MKSTKITYQRAFELAPFIQEKIAHEVEVEDGDNPDDCFQYARQKVMDWWENELHINPIPGEAIIKVESPKSPTEIIEAIEACTEIDGDNGLLTYRLFSKYSENAAVKAAYDLKMLQLKNKR